MDDRSKSRAKRDGTRRTNPFSFLSTARTVYRSVEPNQSPMDTRRIRTRLFRCQRNRTSTCPYPCGQYLCLGTSFLRIRIFSRTRTNREISNETACFSYQTPDWRLYESWQKNFAPVPRERWVMNRARFPIAHMRAITSTAAISPPPPSPTNTCKRSTASIAFDPSNTNVSGKSVPVTRSLFRE